ncbi:Ig-like domain-containing protein [Rhodococcus marinonascens]|uniref:Ig-like domain-containing protein n=1 Tax=Rhodococcus marinonascens TaxID=38311 RepID=UPI0009328AAA|nr:Ig-like domain-containing protein [Rhodococcus marinonascens]
MSGRNMRRTIGAISAVVVTAGFAVTGGAGVAGADSKSISWSDGFSKFTRTISNVNARPGDTITVSTKFERKVGGVFENIGEVTDVHPQCLTVKSAKVDGKNHDLASGSPRWAQVRGSWKVHPIINPKSHTFEFTYLVGNCDRNVPLETGMRYVGSLGMGVYETKGPEITVGSSTTSTILGVPDDAQVGSSVPLRATVINSFGSVGTGSVEFYDDTTKIGEAPVKDAFLWGVATFDWTPDTEGLRKLSAKYVGTSQILGSQSSVETVQVSPAPDAETVTVLRGPSTAQTGTEVIFGSQVSPTPEGGTVQFRDGDTDLGAPVPVDADGKANITHTFDSEGAYAITAVYGGAPGYVGSTSEAVTVTVNDADGGTGEPIGTGSAGNVFGS